MARKILVLGLGVSGTAVASHALAAGDDVTVYAGKATPASREAAAKLSERGAAIVFDTEDVQGRYDLCVVSPGIPQMSAFYASGKAAAAEIVSEPEYVFRESPENWIAVTGTNGKTTTTALIAHLLREGGGRVELCGNTQDETTTAAVEARGDDVRYDYIVAELSSFQLASTVQFSPRAAVLLNITPDHIAWHGSEEAYADAKLRIFRNMESGQTAVVCDEVPDSDKVVRSLRRRGVRTVRVGRDLGVDCAFAERGTLCCRDGSGKKTRLVDAAELQIKGAHNIENALAAAVVALDLRVELQAVRAGLKSFRPLAHRIEPAGEVAGVSFYDDSKATNVDATVKALTAFPGSKIVLLAGGRDKGTDLSELVTAAKRTCAAVIAYGEAGERFRDAFAGGGVRVELEEGMGAAFERACEVAEPGQTVLLSPACASFDEFSGFAERGECFKQLVSERKADAD